MFRRIVWSIVAVWAVAAVGESGILFGQKSPPGKSGGGAKGSAPANPVEAFLPSFESIFLGPTEQDEKSLEAVTISWAEERKFGQSAVEHFLADLRRQRIPVLKKGPEVEYLQKLVAALRPHMRRSARYKRIDVYLADSPRVDARSFAGGTLVFYRGLLDFAESEAALVGIVGHELSHLDHGHQLVPLKQAKLMQRTFAGTAQSFSLERFFSSGTTLMRLMSRPFRPQDEAAADRDGAEWAYRAGYDPRELARLFDKLAANDTGPAQSSPWTAFVRTHPLSADRAEAVLALFDELQRREPREGLAIGRENLRRRVPLSEENLDP